MHLATIRLEIIMLLDQLCLVVIHQAIDSSLNLPQSYLNFHNQLRVKLSLLLL
jgi:hypothetical protein